MNLKKQTQITSWHDCLPLHFRKLALFALLFISSIAQAQNNPLYLTWDNGVACQVSENSQDRKDYFELIEEHLCLKVCRGAKTTFSIHFDDGSWTSVDWHVSSGVVANPTNGGCEVNWLSGATNGQIGATVHTNNGDLELTPLCVEILKKPRALFAKAPFDFVNGPDADTSVPLEACIAEEVFFANGSWAPAGSSAIADYQWDFGDAYSLNSNSSTDVAPSHIYTHAGGYIVSLTVTNACGCTATYTRRLTVGSKSVAIACAAVVCDGQTANYSLNTAVNPQSAPAPCVYDWHVDGGRITSPLPYGENITVDWSSYEHMHPDDGFGYVSFTPDSCLSECYATTTIKIPVIRKTMPINGDEIVCTNTQPRYTLPQWPTTEFDWYVVNSGGTDATLVITDQRNEVLLNPGTVTGWITLGATYQNTLLQCGGKAIELKIQVKTDAAINGPTEVCLNTTADYSAVNGAFANWSLKKPDGSVTSANAIHFLPTFTMTGDYVLTLTSASFCSAKGFIIHCKSAPAPTVAEFNTFNPDLKVCPSSPSQITYNNTVPGTVVGWSVPAAIGTIVGSPYGNNIQVIFNTPIPEGSVYSITLWREFLGSPACKSAEITIALPEIPFAIAEIFGEDHPCASSFQTYEVAEAEGETYKWSIDPVEAGSVQANGSKFTSILWNQFSVLTTATLKLEVTKCNITKAVTKTIYIGDPSIVIVGPTGPICRNALQSFTITTVPQLNSSTGTVTWNFGDGTSAEGVNASHTYTDYESPTAIHHTVTVTVTTPNGCEHSIAASTDLVIAPASPVHL